MEWSKMFIRHKARELATSTLGGGSKLKNYQYVVVGGGSAGCVVAQQLAQAGKKVAMIEKGPDPSKNLILRFNITMPLAFGYNMHDERVNYCYYTVEQQHMNHRKLYCPRGKVLGGSSSINGMVYVRGHPLDFEGWSSSGATNWGYADCLPYFKKAETCNFEMDTRFRGNKGLLHLSRAKQPELSDLVNYFFSACDKAGIPKTNDFNGECQEGYGLYDRTIHNGCRNDTFTAFIKNQKKLEWINNIDVFNDCTTTKICFDGKAATGVEVVPHNSDQVFKISCSKEVIICAGAINSPKLLMLSGIGDGQVLESMNLNVLHHLPGVGKNLQDHLEFYIQHSTNSPDTLHDIAGGMCMKVREGIKWMYNGSSLCSASHLDAGAFTVTDPSVTHPDVQIHFFPYGVIDHGLRIPSEPCFQLHIGTLRADSKGTVRLNPANPMGPPIIDPCYLSEEKDLQDLVKCLDIGREILAQSPLQKWSLKELLPGSHVKSHKEKEDYVRKNAESAYHVSCSCKMGSDSDALAVLDPELKVRGVERVRVVDASSFPNITSGNLNACVIMLAHKASDMILQLPPLPRDSPPFKVRFSSSG